MGPALFAVSTALCVCAHVLSRSLNVVLFLFLVVETLCIICFAHLCSSCLQFKLCACCRFSVFAVDGQSRPFMQFFSS